MDFRAILVKVKNNQEPTSSAGRLLQVQTKLKNCDLERAVAWKRKEDVRRIFARNGRESRESDRESATALYICNYTR
jgi:hypothetical protein